MVNYGQIRTATLRLLDEFSSRGSILAANKTADYSFKIQQITNESIYEIASTTGKLPKTLLIPHNPIKNALSDDTSSIKQHLPGSDFPISLQNAKSCFFEVARFGVIVLEESSDGGVTYSTIETITVPSTTEGFAEYKRLITPTLPTNTVRLRFTGDSVYLFRNYVLYQYSFPSQADVPSHGPTTYITTPADFLDFNYAEIKRDRSQSAPYSEITKSPDNRLSFPSAENPCEIIIHYWRKPTLLVFTDVAVTDDAMLIDLRDDASLIIAYNCAGTIQNSEEMGRGDSNLKKYTEKRMNLIPNTTSRINVASPRYTW